MKYVESGTSHSHSVGYTYDNLNRLTQLVESVNGVEHTTSYTYDVDNRLTGTVTQTDDQHTITNTYTYDAYGRLTGSYSWVDGYEGIYKDFIFKVLSNGQPTGQIINYQAQAPEFTVNFDLTYDDNGNITSVAYGLYYYSYEYDSANQLTRENNSMAGKTWVWVYDDAGNILRREEYAYTTGALGSIQDTIYYTYGNTNWGDLLTAYDGKAITYDGIGNPLTYDGWTFTWEHGRELTSMLHGSYGWYFTYDVNGLRTQRTNGATTYQYVYNSSQLVQMTVGSHKLEFFYDASGAPVVVLWNGTPYYYVTSLQGDVVLILDNTGELVVSYDYDAWGNILATGGSLAPTLGAFNPLRYRGYVYDSETGLYYLQSRYYNPTWGRFLNADALVSTGQGELGNNMFAYCLNNPVNLLDPSGTYAKIWGELFRDHDPGYIHRLVQAHIISTELFQKELVLPGVGRADIWNPETFEIWEIKHGGSTADMQTQRTQNALNQVNRYVTKYTDKPLRIGHAGAFTGSFLFNSGNITYTVTYETPQPGVILYYVEQSKEYDSSVLRVYLPAEDKVKQSLSSLVALGFVLACTSGASSLDPLCQKAYAN